MSQEAILFRESDNLELHYKKLYSTRRRQRLQGTSNSIIIIMTSIIMSDANMFKLILIKLRELSKGTIGRTDYGFQVDVSL